MAWLTINLIDVLLDLGVTLVLVQNRSATQADYDTAWTVRLGQSILTASVTASLQERQRLTLAIHASGACSWR